MRNPYKHKNNWYFFNEAFELYGPFKTEQDAQTALQYYLKKLG